MPDVDALMAEVARRAGERKSADPEARRPEPPASEDDVSFDAEMAADLAYMNARHDTAHLPMFNIHGRLITWTKFVINRLIRFHTFWQANFNAAVTRLLNRQALKQQAIARRLAAAEEENRRLRRDLDALQKRIDHPSMSEVGNREPGVKG